MVRVLTSGGPPEQELMPSFDRVSGRHPPAARFARGCLKLASGRAMPVSGDTNERESQNQNENQIPCPRPAE